MWRFAKKCRFTLFLEYPSTGIGFLVGDKLRVVIAKKDGLVYTRTRSDTDEGQVEESVTSPPVNTGGTSPPPPRPSGTGGTSTAPPRPSGTSGNSGSETFD